jgi:hypothetical protein
MHAIAQTPEMSGRETVQGSLHGSSSVAVQPMLQPMFHGGLRAHDGE